MSVDGFWDAWPASPPSLYGDEPVANQLGPRGKVTTFVNAQGLQLASYYWPAEHPRAVMQHNHGNGSYVMELLMSQGPGKPQVYAGSWVERLNRAGVSVAGHDMQGNGFSQGLRGRRGYFDSLDDVIADAIEFRRHIPGAKVPGFSASLPIFISGHSLGGCVVLSCLQQQAALYRGAVLLAPMVSLEKASRAGLNPYLLPLAKLVSRLAPTLAVASVNRNPLYPEVQRHFDEDPLNFRGNVRARAAAEYLRVTRMMLPRLNEITTPWICFHGEDDTLCDSDGSKQLLEVSKATDKELVMLQKHWHVLIKEPGNEQIVERIIDWVHKRS